MYHRIGCASSKTAHLSRRSGEKKKSQKKSPKGIDFARKMTILIYVSESKGENNMKNLKLNTWIERTSVIETVEGKTTVLTSFKIEKLGNGTYVVIMSAQVSDRYDGWNHCDYANKINYYNSYREAMSALKANIGIWHDEASEMVRDMLNREQAEKELERAAEIMEEIEKNAIQEDAGNMEQNRGVKETIRSNCEWRKQALEIINSHKGDSPITEIEESEYYIYARTAENRQFIVREADIAYTCRRVRKNHYLYLNEIINGKHKRIKLK